VICSSFRNSHAPHPPPPYPQFLLTNSPPLLRLVLRSLLRPRCTLRVQLRLSLQLPRFLLLQALLLHQHFLLCLLAGWKSSTLLLDDLTTLALPAIQHGPDLCDSLCHITEYSVKNNSLISRASSISHSLLQRPSPHRHILFCPQLMLCSDWPITTRHNSSP
jgi:hypothetical protein